MSEKINETNNYSRFVLSSFNRDVKKTFRLRISMLRHGWIPAYPLDVRRLPDGKLEIRDGHHRFEVARNLHIPVKYVECKDQASIPELIRTHAPWSLKDYLTSHVRSGKPAYTLVFEYHKKTGITLSACISLLAGESACSFNYIEKFKEGSFRLGNTIHAEIVGAIVLCCKTHGITFACNIYLVQAISKIAWAKGFDPKVMMNKIASFAEFMTKQPTKQDYVKMLDTIYNRQARIKIPLEFLANEAARQRSVDQAAPTKYMAAPRRR